MKKLLAVILQPPIPALLGLCIVSGVIYYGGGLLRSWIGLSDNTLLWIVGSVWLAALLVFVWKRYQSAKRARLIEDRLRGQAREHIESVRPDKRSQVEELEKQLGTALTTLKSSKLGKKALYELPWYVIIGPPGSGKTTLLKESNLTFPDQAHGRGVRGVGGTRNCDWWFTDQGILLDTAGRYTTQDEDRNEWFSFLDMLKKSRAKKPINGAMIAISISDIIQATDVQLEEHAQKIRERVAELTQRLEVVFPVYLIFSKCDLLDGFVETFGSYGKNERAQTWGFTLDTSEKGKKQLGSQFEAEFMALGDRLAAERLRHLGAAKSKTKKAKIFSFPIQFALLRQRLNSFLCKLEQEDPYHEQSEIKGIYFTSGTQEGQPLDQVLANMRSACGLTEDSESIVEESTDKKSYFIDDVFTEVLFPDKDLARSSTKAQSRRARLRKVSLITTLAASFLILIGLAMSYANHSNQIDRSIEAYNAALSFDASREADRQREEQTDTPGPFEELRQTFEELHADYQSVDSFIMGKSNAIYEDRIRTLYVDKLQKTFLEKIHKALGKSLENAGENPKTTALEISDCRRYYEMLGGSEPYDLDKLKAYLQGSNMSAEPLWTWTEGKQVIACNKHLETMTASVISPLEKDWREPINPNAINKADSFIQSKRLELQLVNRAIESAEMAAPMTWTQILKGIKGAAKFDDNVTIQEAYVNSFDLDDRLKREANASYTEKNLIDCYNDQHQARWQSALKDLRPIRHKNLEDALQDLLVLTGNTGDFKPGNEDSKAAVDRKCAYFEAYKKTCEELNKQRAPDKQIEIKADNFATILASFKEFYDPIEALTGDPSILFGDRVVRDAKSAAIDKKSCKIAIIIKAIKGVRKAINESTGIPAEIWPYARPALLNGIESLEYALAMEILNESRTSWAFGTAEKQRLSGLYPLDNKKAEWIEPSDFDELFGKEGTFSKDLPWIELLNGQLEDLGFVEYSDDFEADQKFVEKIQTAMFASEGESSCKIILRVSFNGQAQGAEFELGSGEIIKDDGQGIQAELNWHPGDKARIELLDKMTGFENGKATTANYPLVEEGPWSILRLLAKAKRDQVKRDGNDWHRATWSDFRTDKNSAASANLVDAKALLDARTYKAQFNPLMPGFFHHTFSTVVFREKK